MKAHYLHLYMGNGKGKTSAAMGLALRAAGHGQAVLVTQWMKDGKSGELAVLAQLPTVKVKNDAPFFGFAFQMSGAELEEARSAQEAHAEQVAAQVMAERPQVIVLDELATALSVGLVGEAAAKALLDTCLHMGETVVTGYQAPTWLCEAADYLSEITAVKHPYATEGLTAREGIEF